jgi:hypothetical protein
MPQQNGVAERKNHHLLETVHILLFAAKLPNYLWEEAARTAIYLINRMPTKSLAKTIPFGRYFGINPISLIFVHLDVLPFYMFKNDQN